VSLTVNGVTDARFDINLVPHTLAHTTLRDYKPGRRVNLEVDMLARYLERLLQGEAAATGISHQALAQAGFITTHD
jgi:riboflavin synthase